MNENEIKEAISNIRELKELITNKQRKLRPMVFSKEFINMLLSASILLLITTIITGVGYLYYPSFWEFSILLKAIIILSILLNLISVSIQKLKAFNSNTTISLSTIFNEVFNLEFIISVLISIFFCVIFVSITGQYWVYLPIITICYGAIIISQADKFGVLEFKVMGYITIFIGIISMLFIQIPLLLLGFSMYTLIFFSYYILLNSARRNS